MLLRKTAGTAGSCSSGKHWWQLFRTEQMGRHIWEAQNSVPAGWQTTLTVKPEAIEYAHLYGVRIYHTVNILIKEENWKSLRLCKELESTRQTA